MRRLLVIVTSGLLLLQAAPVQAWNARGHMTVAAVAWSKMSAKSRARAADLIKRNPRFAAWTKGVPARRKAQIAFVKAATWPDEIRGMVCASGPDCYQDDGYTPADAGSGLNIGYADHRLRRYWHFKDLPFSADGTPLKPPFAPNAQTQIEAFSASLASPQLTEDAKSYNLTWLLHLVGDVHQPLHATARFSQQFPDGDKGGNGEVVCEPAPARCQTSGKFAEKLHGLWDNAIGTNSSPAAAIAKAARLVSEADRRRGFMAQVMRRTNLDAPPAAWMAESFQLARKYVYVPPIGDGKGPHFPDAAYKVNMGSIASQQILIAGERLARLLDRAFAP
ncbi:S1/P1 nuclease [Novosphingobium sp.]|uniref:S1/P1 nuclease n=1 Tax=Novosphingobium sp. TaxID=1874826 RepID=UPI003BABCBF3